MKILIAILTTLFTCLLASGAEAPIPDKEPIGLKNKIYLLPTIHSRHLKKGEFYNLKHLAWVISEIKADIICAEITPQALDKVKAGKKDRRLSCLPEYTEVILKLQKDLGYNIIPCSAWTAERNFKTIGVKAMSDAHYEFIAKALDTHTNQQKRIIISFGSGHISNLLTHLRKRDDIYIIDYRVNLKEQRELHQKTNQ